MEVGILNEEQVGHKLKRMAYEIWEKNSHELEIVVLGIEKGGAVIAKNLEKILRDISPLKVSLEMIKIDKKNPDKYEGNIANDIGNKVVILVDDVAMSGKTLLYAMRPLLLKNPKKIQIAVLVDRQHKNFPVVADFIGYSIATAIQEHIEVTFEGDNVSGAFIK